MANSPDSSEAPQVCRCYLCDKGISIMDWDNKLVKRLEDFGPPNENIEKALKLAAETCDGWKLWHYILHEVLPIDWSEANELRFHVDYKEAFGETKSVRARIMWKYEAWLEEDKRPFDVWELFPLPGRPGPWPDMPPSNMLPATTSSDETFEIAKFWLSDCVSHHDLCNRTTNSSARLPPRLLDIGLLETARIVRVVDTRGELVDKYVCLSHCWGTINMPFRSTSQNIKILNNGVLMSDLPQTFQDAVWVTHLLSFQYLWIDSLCILQDDVEDWKSHTTIMTDIYQNAHLVLAATWGRDSHSGLFRSSSEYSPKELPLTWADKHAGPLYMRKPLPHWWGQTSFGKNDYWHRAFVDELPLLERAWVFQERLLSKRILHFTPAELHFECREELKCQCTHGLRVYNSHPKARHSRVLQEGGAREIGIRWRAIVTEYSKLDLSFATDRLPALLGIAKEIQAASPSRIIAGCWEKTLSDDLLWTMNDLFRPEECTRSLESPCPTWSWASAPRNVYYSPEPAQDGPERARIVNVKVDESKRLDDSVFLWASITLHAPLLRGTIEDNFFFVLKGDAYVYKKKLCIMSDYNYALEGPGHIADGDELFCAWMAEGMFSTNFRPAVWGDFALVLRCIDTDQGLYERVGNIKPDADDQVGATFKERGSWTTFTLV